MSESIFKKFLIEFQHDDLTHFNEFYEATKKSVFYNILSFVKSYETSEDILQDTYVKFLKNVKELKHHTSILGYLIMISKNLSLDYLKKIKDSEIEDDYQVKDEEDFNQDKLILLEKLKSILKDKEYEVLVFHIYDELTFEEISSLTGTPLGTTSYRYNNAIKKAKEVLLDETY